MPARLHFLPRILAVLGLAGGAPLEAETETGEGVIKRWLATNASHSTLRVEFTQTRRMTGLKNPVRKSGVLWLDKLQKRFRWQIGDPPNTIVISQGAELLIVRPRAKKFERRPRGDGRETGLAVLAKGFPRSLPAFQRKYRLLHVKPRKDTMRIVTQPLDQSARGVRTFTFVVGSKDYRLQAMDLTFRDGSTQQVQFTKVSVNVPIDPELFAFDLSGHQVAKF